MQIVINIDEEKYKWLKEHIPKADKNSIVGAVVHGTPLPKGHGDLITKEQAIELVEFYQINPQHFNFVNLIDEIKDEKPIIKADKE